MDATHLPAPGTPEWDSIVRTLNLKNPVLAQEFSSLGYDPAELANSELVERQASRAASRTGPLDALKAPFRTKTVNGDPVPNTSLVRNIVLSTAAAAALAFYFLVPSEPNKAEASATTVPTEETTLTDTATPTDGVPTPEESGVTPPDDAIPTNTLADTPLPPNPDEVAALNDPTGIGEPIPTPPDTLDVSPNLASPPPAEPAPTPIVFNAAPQTSEPPSTQSDPEWDTPIAPSPTATGGATPRASSPIVIRDPGTGGAASVPVPTLSRTSSQGEGDEARVGLSRTAPQGQGAGQETAARTRTLSGTRASGGGGESSQGEGAGSQGTTRGLSATQAGNAEGGATYALRTTPAAEGTQTRSPGLSSAAGTGGSAGGNAPQGTPSTGLRSSPTTAGEAGSTRAAYGLSSTGRTNAGSSAATGSSASAPAAGESGAAREAGASGGVGLLSSAGNTAAQASGGGQGAARSYGLSSTAAGRSMGTAASDAAGAVTQGAQAVTAAATAPVAPYAVGRPVQAKLTLGVGVVEGAEQTASMPVYAESEDGAMWRGTAVLDGRGRVRVTFDAVLRDNQEFPLLADAYGTDGLPGVPARVRLTTPNLAATLLSGLASGVKSFAEAMVNQRQVTVQPGMGGSNVVTNSSANTPNFWLMTAGSTLGSVSVPQGKGGMVNVAEVQPGAALQIVVRRTTRGE